MTKTKAIIATAVPDLKGYPPVISKGTHGLPATAQETIAALAQQITALLLADAPEGVDHIKGVSWAVFDGQAVAFWATGRAGLGNLHHYRGGKGWHEQKLELAQ